MGWHTRLLERKIIGYVKTGCCCSGKNQKAFFPQNSQSCGVLYALHFKAEPWWCYKRLRLLPKEFPIPCPSCSIPSPLGFHILLKQTYLQREQSTGFHHGSSQALVGIFKLRKEKMFTRLQTWGKSTKRGGMKHDCMGVFQRVSRC